MRPGRLVCPPGPVPYGVAYEWMHDLAEQRAAGEIPDTLLLLEHPPVYTRGRRTEAHDLPMGEDWYRAQGIDVVDVDRGGRVTYHGPGQLVGYPIMRIADVGAYLRAMEAAIVCALAREGVHARSRCAEGPDYTGVWVAERKIASIGVHVSRGVSTHGFAINVDNDLEPFSWVIACGLQSVAMTSLARELPAGGALDAQRFRARVARAFCAAHGRRPLALDAAALLSRQSARTRGRTLPASRPGGTAARAHATQEIAIGAGAGSAPDPGARA